MNFTLSTTTREDTLKQQFKVRRELRSKCTTQSYKSGFKHFENYWKLPEVFVDINNIKITDIEHFITEYACKLTKKTSGDKYDVKWIENCFKAVQEVYKEQYLLKNLDQDLDFDSIICRTSVISFAISNYKTNKVSEDKAKYKVKNNKNFTDSYTEEEHKLIVVYFLKLKDPLIGLKYTLDHLVGHACLNRGIERREIELSDLFSHRIKLDGIDTVAIIAMIHKTKTNQYVQTQHGAFIRNIDVTCCPVAILYIYLFYRFNISKYGFPDFSHPDQWYDEKLIFWADKNESLSPTAHSTVIRNMVQKLNLNLTKLTHLGRKSMSIKLDESGCSQDQIERMGRWNKKRLTTNYLFNIPQEAIKLAAGATSKVQGSYSIHRATYSPPQNLVDLVFPQINEISQEYLNKDPSAKSFCEMLKYLSITLLQDSALLIYDDAYKEHPVFNHTIFQTQQFKSYSKVLYESQKSYNNRSLATTTMLKDATPEIVDILTRQEESIKQLKNCVFQLDTKMDDLITHSIAINNPSTHNLQQYASNLALIAPIPSQRHDSVIYPSSVVTSTHNTPLTSLTGSPTLVPVDLSSSQLNDAEFTSLMKQLTFTRNLQDSVFELYKYWFIDGDGIYISVVNRNIKYGTRWRSGGSNRTYYKKRKDIVDELIRISSLSNLDKGTVANIMDTFKNQCNEAKVKTTIAFISNYIKQTSVDERTYNISF